MNWIKKLIGASILSSLFFMAPEKALAEISVNCGLYNTGGYNLYVLGQNMNSLATCAAPAVTTMPMVVPFYLSNPSAYLSSFGIGSGGGCGSFTQSCGSCYDTLGFGGYGSLPTSPLIDSQLVQLISYQNGLLNQMSNPLNGTYPNFSYNPYTAYNPYTPSNPYSPYSPYSYTPNMGGIPSSPVAPVSPFDNTLTPTSTPTLPYGGCDNITVMCPQSGVNTFQNTFPVGSGGGGVPLSNPQPTLGSGSVTPNVYQIPRGLRTH